MTKLNTRETALVYMERGWSPIPIARGQKGLNEPGWQLRRLTPADAAQFDRNGNIGVILGAASSGLVDVDLDCPEAVELGAQFLPPTPSIFGRASKPSSHPLYIAAPAALETLQYRDPLDGSMLLELRGEGGFQTVFPPSVHPSGERVTWESDQPPAVVAVADLLRACSRVAAACLVCKYNSGGRAVIHRPEPIWLEALAGRPKELRAAVRSLLAQPDQPPSYRVNIINKEAAALWSADSSIQLWHPEAEPARAFLRSRGLRKPWAKTLRQVIDPKTGEPAVAVALHDPETRMVAGVELITFQGERRVLKSRSAEMRSELVFAYPLEELVLAESFEIALKAGRHFNLPAWSCCGAFPASIALPASVKGVVLVATEATLPSATILSATINRSGRWTSVQCAREK